MHAAYVYRVESFNLKQSIVYAKKGDAFMDVTLYKLQRERRRLFSDP